MIQYFLTLILIVILLPIIIIIALFILLIDGTPILYRQKRLGKNNNEFLIYKFRTMINSVGDIPTSYLKDPDSKITITGRILRKYSLDELPQLFNVLKFDMNIIGYRPCLPNEKEIIYERKKYNLENEKPGITGWAQVNGRDLVQIEEKAYLDSFYYENHSLFLDLES